MSAGSGASALWTNNFVGIPFVNRGRTRKPGLDCWGLYRLVMAERAGIELPSWDAIDALDMPTVSTTIGLESTRPEWREVPLGEARDLDCVLMKGFLNGRSGSWHVGCYVSGKRCLHVEKATAAVVSGWFWIAPRLVSIHRHKGLE